MRRLAWVLLGLAAVLGLAAGAMAWRGKQVAEFAFRAALDRAGVAATALEVRSLGWGSLGLGPLRLGDADGPSTERIELGWSLAGLMSARIDSIRVEKLRLALAAEEGGIRILGLPELQGGSGGGLPVRQLTLAGAEITLAAPAGTLRAAVDAELTQAGADRLEGQATLDAAWTAKGDKPLRLRVTLPQLSLGLAEPSIAFADATVALPERQLAIAGLTATASLAEAASIRLGGTLRHTATPAAWPALAVEIEGRRAADRLTATGRAASADRALVLTGKAEHTRSSGRGLAEVALAPLHFAADGRQPVDLFPDAGRAVTHVAGSVAAQGQASWDGRGMKTSLRLDLDRLGFDAGTAQLRELTGRILLDPAWPPRALAPQRLTARLALAGLPAGDLALGFSLPLEGQLRIDTATLGLAGGTLSLAGTLLQRDRPLRTTLTVDAVDVGAALHLLDIEGLSGSGTLGGAIPVEVAGGGVTIRNGRLAANVPGVLRYTGGNLPEEVTGLKGQAGEAIRLARQALADFRYQALDLTIDRAADGQGSLLVHLAGSNPAVLDNHPFVLNIRLEANFDRLALLLLDGYAAAEGLLRQAARP